MNERITRGALLAAVRAYFARENVEECWTSALVAGGGVDGWVEQLETMGRRLHTSPELGMKRLLARANRSGEPRDIYQIATVFRGGESGALHRPCFQLLEWYRVGWDEHRLMDDVEALLRWVTARIPGARRGSGELEVERRTLADRLRELGVAPAPSCDGMSDSLGAALEARGERTDMSAEERFHLLCSVTDGALGRERPLFLYGYPEDQGVLAAMDPEAELPARRFELFMDGVELANGWAELSGSAANRARVEAENGKRVRAGLEPHPVDEAFLADMDDLPACAGVALGIDRLHMLLAGVESIRELPGMLSDSG